MSKFIHYSLEYEAEYLKSIEPLLISSKMGLLNFDVRDELPKTIKFDGFVQQLHFTSFDKRAPVNDQDLSFISHGSDVVGLWERAPGLHRRANYYRFMYEASTL